MKVTIAAFICAIILFVPTNATASVIHVVEQGENLSKIADVYGTTPSRLVNINGLPDRNKLIPGQALLVPGQEYVVQPGESLWGISKRHAMSIEKLKSENELDSNIIYPEQKLTIPESSKRKIFTGAFFVPSGDQKANQSVLDHYREMASSVAYFEYHPDTKGNLSTLAGDESVDTAWNKGYIPYATVTNLSGQGFDPDLVHQIVSSQENRNRLIENIYQVLHTKELKGVVIDFEGIHNKDRQYFNTFIKELSDRLHKTDMKVSLSLPPMQGDRNPSYYAGYDYQTLGEYADALFLMTYDWHWSGGPAGPIAPLGEVRDTIEYAVSVVPRSKITLGIPMYAYDWSMDHPEDTRAYAQEHAINTAIKYESVIHYNKKTNQPWFRYTDEHDKRHEVWFEDARSILMKYRLVKEYNLRGMGGWKMGLSFPQAEQLLMEEFDL
ncbi:LysM peptidoglycan-binding domain-containing protein [Lentibacillus cibarius]|uniref:LysM peptidoglycan-binding domain-containing protein n=1 Tax=Lentibacillus cibarius TaxID=2583219 RepID=A0A549YIQ0_9BACI|nr:glycosyl hydrolase family 18 protein [Lentibacillus cibarius]TRM11753.1 LysM peptidoglycan-binding domain-containing protein [Lentibacillus cibarius]